jgi:hypothetical protein
LKSFLFRLRLGLFGGGGWGESKNVRRGVIIGGEGVEGGRRKTIV